MMEYLDLLAEKYHLTLWATIRSGDTVTYQYMDNQGINVLITPSTKGFVLKWNVPSSVFTVECPECSPYDNAEHFDKIYRKFSNTIFKIRRGL